MEKEYWKNVIRSETPDGVIFIDERNGTNVHLLIDYPTVTQEVLCKAVLEEVYWLLDNTGTKLAIEVKLQ
jgi:hypothetical protein